jgi:two-component system response regulator HupR/HoxA
MMTQHHWPGNVRELQNEIRRALALGDGPVLGPELLSPRVRQPPSLSTPASETVEEESGHLKHHLERMEAQLIRAAMRRHKGNKTHVAEELGLTRVGLRMKLARLGME